ncbi:response regulator [Alicyclobacillus macrosporangiidus]|uniref:response regulator n=1 Tax=Alicyclobacillus macrosporangiidus TaxID=392015 RepID=UPI0004955416|nr:response regulator transcription factor [Alicyclobacillus macrosporangiidus]
MSEARTIRLAIVDDHPMVREGLRAFLQLSEDIQVAGEAATGEEAIQLADAVRPDVMLMDLVMPGACDGVAAIREITRRHPDIRIIALTSFQERDRTLGAIQAGAIGYLEKDVSPEDLVTAIRQAAVGRAVLDPAALDALRGGEHRREPKPAGGGSGDLRLREPLTQREQDVLQALAQGMSNKEIAAALGIAEKTVKVHISHILDKLGVYDRTQAVLAATRLGLIRMD